MSKNYCMADLMVFFPITDTKSIVSLLDHLLENSKHLEVSIISLLLGWFESNLTKRKHHIHNEKFPCLDWETFYIFLDEYNKLVEVCRKNIEQLSGEKLIIKTVANFVWGYLKNVYFKDKQHIQTVYNFLNGKQLDCFGIAITILSILKSLGYYEIHLSLSEDHAWLIYNNGNDTAEVTWHGKENSKKRGESISYGCEVNVEKCWLYLGTNYVKCDAVTEVAAIVNSINPGVDSKTDSEIMSRIQQELLIWLYQKGNLNRLPIALSNLADLEEIESSGTAISIERLYEQAIDVNEKMYEASQIYPYTYYAGYLFRVKKYRKALELWKKATRTVSRYNYSKEDEELYKEFNDITNTMLLEVFRCKQFQASLCQTNEIFCNILVYFDYLFLWEMDSKTAIFHDSWAKTFIKIISCFSDEFRINLVKTCFSIDDVKKKEIENLESKVDETPKISSDKDIEEDEKSYIALDNSNKQQVSIRSTKMRSILDVLQQKTLNKSAINLHLCADVRPVKEPGHDCSEYSGRTKRPRRR